MSQDHVIAVAVPFRPLIQNGGRVDAYNVFPVIEFDYLFGEEDCALQSLCNSPTLTSKQFVFFALLKRALASSTALQNAQRATVLDRTR